MRTVSLLIFACFSATTIASPLLTSTVKRCAHLNFSLKKYFSSAQADLFLGHCLMQQPGQIDLAKKHLRKAASLGEPFSQYLLGTIVEDDAERQKWLNEASKQGIGWEEYNQATDYYFPKE